LLDNQNGRRMLSKGKQRGVSLIELMVGITIVGILSMLAAPSFNIWIQNQQIRAGAESILNGIQLARSSAVNGNGQTRFVLCGLPASSWEVLAASATAVAPNAATSPSPACGVGSLAGVAPAPTEIRVQERSSLEGSKSAQVAVNTGLIGVTTINTVTFNGLGRVNLNADGSVPITQIDVSTPTGDRPLRIKVLSGGNTKMCDPSPLLAANDPRHC
jgi:type IV fimbrial biogenesis protein FimT